MSLKDLNIGSDVKEKDTVGGFGAIESDVYPGVIDYAFITKSKGGAKGLSIQVTLDEGNKKHREIIWFTNKAGGTTYKDKQGADQPLPGLLAINSLSICATGKKINECDEEKKTIKLYNFEAKAEVATQVDMVMDLVGKRAAFGIIKQVVDKNVQNGNGDYVPSGETREENVIDKFFSAEPRLTSSEILAEVKEETFVNTWLDKNRGKTKNLAKGAAAAGTAGAPKAAGSTAAPAATSSLFMD